MAEAQPPPSDEAAGVTPVVPASESPAELTFKSIGLGIAFGTVFGAANAYLGLRAGLTVSTSIPIAVITVAVFRALRRAGVGGTLLEANLAQTTGSASSSVASGVIFTLPALFLWELDPSLLQMTLLALCGGVLGVLFMIPLRAYLIVHEHRRLPYPEGTACAEVLIASQGAGGRARNVLRGLATGAAFKLLTGWLKVIPRDVDAAVPGLLKGHVGLESSAALLGVGYILGPRVGAVMVGGGLLSSLVLIPTIAFFGAGRPQPLYPELVETIAEMGPDEIWSRYVRYIGAGAVAAGGLITLARSAPTMLRSFQLAARQLGAGLGGAAARALPRTSRDLPVRALVVGIPAVVLALTLVPAGFATLPGMGQRAIAATLVAVAAFFFVTVASRIVGLVGVTSNPTSGMTIATLLATSGVFLALGWTGDAGKAAALTVGCVVAVAASTAGDMSQDLKTGFLLGATPSRQQLGQLLGVLVPAAFVCASVLVLDQAHGFGSRELPAPQASLMKLVIEGVLSRSLPWELVALGVAVAVVAEVLGLPSLAFAVGVYLPVSTMTPVFLGGLLCAAVARWGGRPEDADARHQEGVLFGSGLVGGEGLIGVAIAAVAFLRGAAPSGVGTGWAGAAEPLVGFLAFVGLGLLMWSACRRAAAAR